MTEYKSFRIIDGKPKLVIIDENGKIVNRDPNTEELKGIDKERYIRNKVIPSGYYNRTNKCDICNKENLRPGKAKREYDAERNWTGRWLCDKCWYHADYKKRPDCTNNILKSIANIRTGNSSNISKIEKGKTFEQLTCAWRKVENKNIEIDNYHSPLDHSIDSELGIIQTKGAFLSTIDINRKCWVFLVIDEHGKIFDYLICYCLNNNKKNIERIYIFPWKEVMLRKSIKIYKDARTTGWYEIYRVNDDMCNNVDKIFGIQINLP